MTHTWISIAVLISVPLLALLYMYVSSARRKARRKQLAAAPFPAEWEKTLERNIPPYKAFPSDIKEQLHGLIHIFLDEKKFEGCDGVTITDEIRLTVAGEACILLLNRKTAFFAKLRTILIYPAGYIAGGKGIMGGQLDERSARLGESWTSGTVVLSWDDVKRSAANFHDGHNLTFHEFAHQLDQEDGSGDGTPILAKLSSYATWAKILTDEYRNLQNKKQRGKRSVLDKYGATNPAEFFAVATETFLEKPRQLKKKHPDLYAELKEYYKLDPVEWDF